MVIKQLKSPDRFCWIQKWSGLFKVCLFLPDIKFRIKSVEVLGIQMFFDDVQPFAEMSNLRKWLEPFICKGFSRFLKFDIMLC